MSNQPRTIRADLNLQKLQQHKTLIEQYYPDKQFIDIADDAGRHADFTAIDNSVIVECKTENQLPKNICVEILTNYLLPSYYEFNKAINGLRIVSKYNHKEHDFVQSLILENLGEERRKGWGINRSLGDDHRMSILFTPSNRHYLLKTKEFRQGAVMCDLNEHSYTFGISKNPDGTIWISVCALYPIAEIEKYLEKRVYTDSAIGLVA